MTYISKNFLQVNLLKRNYVNLSTSELYGGDKFMTSSASKGSKSLKTI